MSHALRILTCCIALLLAAAMRLTGADTGIGMRWQEMVGSLANPVAVVPFPDDPERFAIIEQRTGNVRSFLVGDASMTTIFTVALPGYVGYEQGLLGLAFHPDFASNGWIFVHCTDAAGDVQIRRYTIDGTYATVLTIAHGGGNHNGGWIEFGPDGRLYIGIGDGGGAGDMHGIIGNAQDPTKLLGKILRYDVGASGALQIPADNPIAASPVWALGLRNPWRCSFDLLTGDLWIGDVGQDRREEIDLLPAGESGVNFGWRIREGSADNPDNDDDVVPRLREPVFDYGRTLGSCVIGGIRYRGAAIPRLQGRYLFGDNGSGSILSWGDGALVDHSALLTLYTVVSFGQDADGEILACSHRGSVYKLAPACTVTSLVMPAGFVGVPYTARLSARTPGDDAVWTLVSGDLPAGLTWSADGTISGMPIETGDALVTFSVSSAGIAESGVVSVRVSEVTPLRIATTSLSLHVDEASSQQLLAEGGVGTTTWSLVDGRLPPYLVLEEDGRVLGNVPEAGDYACTIRAEDAVGNLAEALITLHVSPDPVILSTPGLEIAIGDTWAYYPSVAGEGPLTLSLVSAPAGAQLHYGYPGMSWIPALPGDGAFVLRITNARGVSIEQAFTVRATTHGLLRSRPWTSPYLGMPYSSIGEFPGTLSATGARIFTDITRVTPAPHLIPYSINTPFWSDGAQKDRWIGLSLYDTIGWSASSGWSFPAGTAFVKHFRIALDERHPENLVPIETRVLMRTPDGVSGMTYRWRASYQDADAVATTQTQDIPIISADGSTRILHWAYPSPDDCMSCHTANAGYILGVNARQLHRNHTYGSVTESQLTAWRYAGLFTTAPADADIALVVRLASLGDDSASLAHRARSYLDANCSYCHRPGGAPATFDARISTALASAGLIDALPGNTFGNPEAKIIAPGRPDLSVLLTRIHSDTAGVRMPPVGRTTTDATGAAVVREWIVALGADPLPEAADDSGRCANGGIAALFGLLTGVLVLRSARRR